MTQGARTGTGSRWLVGAVATLALAAACGSGKPVTRSPSTLSQRFADGGACPVTSAREVPAGSGCVTSVVADLDGDGTADRFVVFARLKDGKPASWWAAGLLAGAVRITPPFPLPTGSSVGGDSSVYPRVAGAAEANGEPGAEVFVQLSADLYHSG